LETDSTDQEIVTLVDAEFYFAFKKLCEMHGKQARTASNAAGRRHFEERQMHVLLST